MVSTVVDEGHEQCPGEGADDIPGEIPHAEVVAFLEGALDFAGDSEDHCHAE